MDNFWQLIGVLVALSTLATLVTGTSVYFMRKTTEDMKKSNVDTKEEMKKSNVDNKEEIKTLLSELGIHIDSRVDRIHTRIDQTSTDLRDYVAKEIAQLQQKSHDQDMKIERGAERITKVNEDLLKFKLEVSEKYQRQ